MAKTAHNILIVGAGTAGLTVAARLRRGGHSAVTVLDPAATHYYQPLWTLVGGGFILLGLAIRYLLPSRAQTDDDFEGQPPST